MYLFRMEEPEPCCYFSDSSKGYQSPPGKAGKSGHGSSHVKPQQDETAAFKTNLCKVISEQGKAAAEGSRTFLQFCSKRLNLALSLLEGKHVMTGPQSFYFEAKCLECMKTAKAFSFRRYKSNKWRQSTAILCSSPHKPHLYLGVAKASMTRGAWDWQHQQPCCPRDFLPDGSASLPWCNFVLERLQWGFPASLLRTGG